jgi:lysophospholipase L1-like esterase
MTEIDDGMMNRFEADGLGRFRARDAVLAVALVSLLLILFEGPSIRGAGERMEPGLGRSLVMLASRPAGWLADRLPLAAATDKATAWLSPDDDLRDTRGFAAGGGRGAGSGAVTADAFEPSDLGRRPPTLRPLRRLLVTGDSLSTPLDVTLARRLSPQGVEVIREPHLGTGISKSFVVDWARLAAAQVRKLRPDAVVVFIGANEGFPLPGADGESIECCGPEWAAAYANRVRRMADTYRRGGAARVYWITVPTPRDPDRRPIARTVNAAINVATAPWRAQVRVIETVPIFAPEGYRDAMPVRGEQTIVRESDGIHLNEAGASVLADALLSHINRDHTYGGRTP